VSIVCASPTPSKKVNHARAQQTFSVPKKNNNLKPKTVKAQQETPTATHTTPTAQASPALNKNVVDHASSTKHFSHRRSCKKLREPNRELRQPTTQLQQKTAQASQTLNKSVVDHAIFPPPLKQKTARAQQETPTA
jgi:hypothetical protein